MEEMNEIQFQILDSLYFVEPFDNILAEVKGTEPIVASELKSLIRLGWVQVMDFDTQLGDFKKTMFYDSDNMRAFSYLATKEGMLRHNGFGQKQ